MERVLQPVAAELSVKKIEFEEGNICVLFTDGRTIKHPLSWYPQLLKGTEDQRLQYELWNDGKWIHWEALDEDLSAEGFLSFSPKTQG